MRTMRGSLAAVLLVAAGCSGDRIHDEQASSLGGVTYGMDGGSSIDSGIDGAIAQDSGVPADASFPTDASVPPDASVPSDGGFPPDASVPDAAPPDADTCTAQYDPPPPEPPDPGPPESPPPEPDQCTWDICDALASGELSPGQVSQQTYDECNGLSPMHSCLFTPYPDYFGGDAGCSVYEFSAGYLGNFRYDCPNDPYAQKVLCDFAIGTQYPIPTPADAVAWLPGVGEPEEPLNESDEEENGNPGEVVRNVVVIGSSMLSTHNQVRNGPDCWRRDINGTVLTATDNRNMAGNDFNHSPAYKTRVPWWRVFRGARTGHTSDNVLNATMNPRTNDGCENNWTQPVPPADAGVQWFQGKNNRLMITDGGLINDQKNVDDHRWPKTLAGVVVCQAMEAATPAVNTVLEWDHWVMNWFWSRVWQGNRWVPRVSPQVRLQRWVPAGNWAGALDLGAGQQRPKCQWIVNRQGNGRMPASLNLVLSIGKEVSPLVRLHGGLPANNQIRMNLAAIKDKYFNPFVSKQIWLQYPYMDKAQVTVRGGDVALLWPGGASATLIRALGHNLTLTVDAVDGPLQPRIRKVSDDLNHLMWVSVGCAGAWAVGHARTVCARNGGNPAVVVTRDNHPNWGVADHQSTIIGGMPHPSVSGSDKLGLSIVDADGAP